MYRIYNKYIIVDGYNYINQDGSLRCHLETSLDAARSHLNEVISEFCAYSGEQGIVVYDATRGERGIATVEEHRGIEVVFTKQNETADTYIERLVANLLKDKTNQVRVITQDWAEQLVILGSGGLRVSASEFKRELSAMKVTLVKNHSTNTNRGVTLDDALDEETLSKLRSI